MSRFQSLLASSLWLSQLSMQNAARVQRTAISQGECRSSDNAQSAINPLLPEFYFFSIKIYFAVL